MLVISMLVGILLVALGVSGWLLFQLQRNAAAFDGAAVVPVEDLNGGLSSRLFDEQKKVFEAQSLQMKEELDAAKSRLEQQERQSAEIITDLRGQCDTFKRKVIDLESLAQSAPPSDESMLDHLRAENAAFRAQLDETASSMRQMKESFSALERENASLKESAGAVTEAQRLVDAARQEYQHQMEGFYKEIEQLRAESVRLQEQSVAGSEVPLLRQSVDELTARLRELESVNSIQAEKNEYLQYELTKSRAQVVGLERLCENMSSSRMMAGGRVA